MLRREDRAHAQRTGPALLRAQTSARDEREAAQGFSLEAAAAVATDLCVESLLARSEQGDLAERVDGHVVVGHVREEVVADARLDPPLPVAALARGEHGVEAAQEHDAARDEVCVARAPDFARVA